MICCLTGTPGTGKSTVARLLAARGHHVVSQSESAASFSLGHDEGRDTEIIDEEAWAASWIPEEGIVEGHLTHLLSCDRVVVLRCRPDVLASRLRSRGYPDTKVQENAEAEALDVILVEAEEAHPPSHILEIDATSATPEEVADTIEAFMGGEQPPGYGRIDWSEYLGTIV